MPLTFPAVSRRGAFRTSSAWEPPSEKRVAQSSFRRVSGSPTPSPLTEPSVYDFTCNFDYLEAEYNLRGLTNQGLVVEHTDPILAP